MCTDGWILNPVKTTCIKFFSETKTANEAKESCQSFGASLLMLNSEEVIEWYQTLLAEKACKFVHFCIIFPIFLLVFSS